MPITLRVITTTKNVIRFSSKVDDNALKGFVPALYDLLSRGYEEIVLDFRRSQLAYADAVLPIICLLDHRRRKGDSFRALLPDSAMLRQLFLNSNWAHYMDSAHAKVNLEHRQHVPARRYGTHAEQQEAVNAIIDVVLRNVEGLKRDVLAALEWSVNEITDNVLNHAQSPEGGLVQVNTFRDEHKLKFVVADAGRGIPVAMREAFPHLHSDDEAIAEAVKAGVTSIPDSGQGNGLAGSLRIATYASGSFKITSGKAQLIVFRDPRTREYRTMKGAAPRGFRFPGTAVMMELSTDSEFAIGEALALGGGTRTALSDVVDLAYGSAAGDMVIRVREEAAGVGTRHAGVELRRKALNLLGADPAKRLVLDWTGVPLISSSFADEAIGKLFVELGPTTFVARISHSGAEELVRSLLDRAVMQRVAQTMSRTD